MTMMPRKLRARERINLIYGKEIAKPELLILCNSCDVIRTSRLMKFKDNDFIK